MAKSQTALEYLMTYGWAILIILIVAGVLAYYGIFAPAGFLGPTARGFGQVQVLSPWSLSTGGVITLNLENRVGGTIDITDITVTLTNGGSGNGHAAPTCTDSSGTSTTNVTSGGRSVCIATITGLTYGSVGSSYTATVTITYKYQSGNFTSTGTISGIVERYNYIISQTICQNAEDGELCEGLDIAYGEGYRALCCSEYGLCC